MKTTKLFALFTIVIFALSCKKEKQKEITCNITSVIADDSATISYNSSNKISNIKIFNTPDIINIDFMNEGGFHKETITTNNISLPGFTINYSLNANGFIDRFQQTITNPSVYVNIFRCKYDAEGHLILHEHKVTKSGSPYSYDKDSSVYENGNMTKLFRFMSLIRDTVTTSLNSTTLITYNTQINTAGLYINQLMAPNNIVGTSTYYLKNFPYIFHLYGKGCKNLPISSTTTFSSGASGYAFSFDYTINENNLITSQTINRTPTTVSFPKISRFYYECN